MEYLFLLSLLMIAFLYSSVGHCGGTGYLALLALYDITPVLMKPTALTNVNASTYKIILGIFLLIAIGRILLVPNAINEKSVIMPIIPAVAAGALLGFFSGMIGIGGGITGSYIGSFRLKPDKLKFVLASVLLMASIKLFIF